MQRMADQLLHCRTFGILQLSNLADDRFHARSIPHESACSPNQFPDRLAFIQNLQRALRVVEERLMVIDAKYVIDR